MSVTVTNLSSVVAQRSLGVSQRQLALSLERLSSGLRINRGADDPAGLIVSERLRAEIAAVNQAIDNSTRAINVIATTEGALNEINALLIDSGRRGGGRAGRAGENASHPTRESGQ